MDQKAVEPVLMAEKSSRIRTTKTAFVAYIGDETFGDTGYYAEETKRIFLHMAFQVICFRYVCHIVTINRVQVDLPSQYFLFLLSTDTERLFT